MPSAAYTTAAEGFSKQVQWLVEIDLDRCNLNYTTSPCTASDQGDGSRCYYSFRTCQDVANYDKTTRTYRFCLNDVPWPDPATAVYPYLRRIVPITQRIEPRKLTTFPEKVTLDMMLDFTPPAPDSDKTLFNTASVGEFFHNLFRRNSNYPGRALRILRGFNASGFVLSDFEQVGPAYKLKEVQFDMGSCRITAESPLADLNKRELVNSISEDNTIQDVGGINDSDTSVTVVDASEYPDPADFSRNTLYIEMESEICSYTTRNTTTNVLSGLTRGAFGTSAAAHAAGVKVAHVACFGSATGTAVNSVDTIRDLLEWAGVAAGDVDTAAFDAIKSDAWPDNDVLRVLRRPVKISKLVQELRELRGLTVYMDAAGQWSAKIAAPAEAAASLDDDSWVKDSVSIHEDEENRITRALLLYDPDDDDKTSERKDYSKAIMVIDASLETANNYGDVKEDTIMDPWIDPSLPIAKIRNIARRTITRRAAGIRTIQFALEVKDATLNVGDPRTVKTRHLTDINGAIDAHRILVTTKRELDRATVEYESIDLNFNGRYLRIGSDTITDDYDTATDEEREYGYWGDADNRVGAQKEPGYLFW